MTKQRNKIFLSIIFVFSFFTFFPLLVKAQTGTSADPTGGAAIDPTTQTTPTPEPVSETSSTTTTTTPTSTSNTTTPTPAPKSTKPAIPPQNNSISAPITPIPPVQNSTNYIPTILTGLGAGIIISFLFGLNAQRNKKQNKKKKESKCLNFKKLMEEKFEELKDLKSQLADFAQEKAGAKIKEVAEGTKAGEILSLIENGNKEYKRLKDLYEKCITEISKSNERLSYLMGAETITEEDINNLGIQIEEKNSKGHFMVKIPEEKLNNYIELIKTKLNKGFWNEIVSEKEIIFIFKFLDGHTEEYKLSKETEEIIKKLCTEFNSEPSGKTQNIYKYLSENNFYHDTMMEHYKDDIY